MHPFWQYSGYALWLLLGIGFIAVIIYRKYGWGRIIYYFLLGNRLEKAGRQLVHELPDKVQKDTLADVATAIFSRLTFMGGLALFLALAPITLLWIQNKKIDNQNILITSQNNLIESQNYLSEAERRSSLVLLMDNILTDVSYEIREQKEGLNEESLEILDSVGYRLSDPLIGRIAALSQGLLPYRFMVDGKLTEKEYSVERGQLLLALVKSNLDSVSYRNIYGAATFSNSYLKGADLISANLISANLRDANLRDADLISANLRDANLSGADLSDANLSDVNLIFADLIYTNLRDADLISAYLSFAYLSDANLISADLRFANLISADLISADLSYADLISANLSSADLSSADLSSANLHYARNLTLNQLKEVSNLNGCRNLDQELAAELKKENPALFEIPERPR